MLPDTPHTVNALSGFNVSYKREILEEAAHVYRDGFYENFVHDELLRLGHEMFLTPSAAVYHNKNYNFGMAITDAFHHARAFAARRVLNAQAAARFVFVLKSFVLPILLPSRVVAVAYRKGTHIKELLRSLPYLILLLSVWSFGEFCGYLFGAGRSEGKWK